MVTTRSKHITFGREAARRYNPAIHGADEIAFFDLCMLAPEAEGIDHLRAFSAFAVELMFIADEQPTVHDDRPSAVSGVIVCADS